MDPKAQMPDIKTEVNKVDDNKKKSSGLLGSLFGGGGSGAGGIGGLGGASGMAASGGLLATKAGIIALVVMGSAVAGGLGLAGYKLFGPSDADRMSGSNIQVFQTKPKEAENSGGVAPVAADGSSASLNYLAAAAAKDKQDAAPTDQTAGDASKAAADEAAKKAADEAAAKKAADDAAAQANKGPINSGGGVGATGSMSHLNGVKKLGALSGVTGGGSSTAGASVKSGTDLGVAAQKNGSTSGFARGGGAAAKASTSAGRGIASRRGASARQQLASTLSAQRGAGSSQSAGAVYDGGRAGGNGIDGGNAIGGDPGGSGAGAQPKTLPQNSAPNTNKQEQIPEPPARDVTPWQGMLNAAVGLMAVSGLLMYAASKLLADVTPTTKPFTVTIAKILLGLAIAAALAAVALGTRIATAEFGQKLQGGLIIGGALCAGAMATYLLSKVWSMGPGDLADDQKTSAIANVAKDSSTLVMISGGAAACALAGAMMAPKTTVKEKEAKEAGVPYSWVMPSDPNRYTV